MPTKVKVFIGWSQRRSKAVALALREWLPQVIQAIEPWLSEDIERGSQWFERIGKHLATADYGILCVTPENQDEPWVLFEAGALAIRTNERQACPYLLDMAPGDLAPPLGMLQAAKADKEHTRKMVETINGLVDQALRVSAETVQRSFDTWWPQLEKKIEEARKITVPATRPATRSDAEKLDEILAIVREMQRAAGRGTPTEQSPLATQLLASLGYGDPTSLAMQNLAWRSPGLGMYTEPVLPPASTSSIPSYSPSKPMPSASQPQGKIPHKPKKE